MRNRAFTLIEILVVVTIITILISLVSVSIGHSIRTTRLTNCQANLRSIHTCLMAYAQDGYTIPPLGDYPPDSARRSFEIADKVWTCPADPNKGVNRRGGLTSYSTAGITNMNQHSMRGPNYQAAVETRMADRQVMWDYERIHFKKRDLLFVDGSVELSD